MSRTSMRTIQFVSNSPSIRLIHTRTKSITPTLPIPITTPNATTTTVTTGAVTHPHLTQAPTVPTTTVLPVKISTATVSTTTSANSATAAASAHRSSLLTRFLPLAVPAAGIKTSPTQRLYETGERWRSSISHLWTDLQHHARVREEADRDFLDVPELTYQSTPFNRHLLQHTPALSQPFTPIPWMRTGHAQTILGTALRFRPKIIYHRELLALPDGGRVALDWDSGQNHSWKLQFQLGHPHPTSSQPSSSTKPVLILLPGLTGGSRTKYMCQVVEMVRELGWHCVVFNPRGIGIPMETALPSTGINIEDVIDTFKHIHACYPHSPKLCLGFSMGANMLVKTLGTLEEKARSEMGLKACAAVSCAFDFVKLIHNLHTPLRELLYVRFLTFQLKNAYMKQKAVQHLSRHHRQIDLQHALNAATIAEFDERFTRHLYGMDLKTYYEGQSSKYVVNHIQTPLLILNALDDPFEGEIPYDCIRSNPHIILATTKRGGHVSHASGMNPFAYKSSWMMTTTLEFLQAALIAPTPAAVNSTAS